MVGGYATAKFHVLDMIQRYEAITQLKCGYELSSSLYHSHDNIPIVLTIVKNHGIPYSRGSLDPRGSVGSLKIKYFFHANRFPLVAGIRYGALFQFVNSDQKYLILEIGLGYALALIGAGVEVNKKTGKIETYFIARNSAGYKTHST
ncbi:hypothetical protein SETIT_5G006800v2 [Setaria italica]|uniref:Uncharacterized protein n=1 Tax=Setaria italica TaxID=4555 RepID=K3XRS3_SETIT|nr:hypothetical protein SETIT_5G006800v2 [Setaria italica]